MLEVRCLGDISPKVWASYTYSKNAVRMTNSAKDLVNKIPQEIAIELEPGRHVERLAGYVVGLDSELEELQKLAEDDKVSIVGIYGMGGVGKTALLDKFHDDSPLKDSHLMIVVDMDDCHTVRDAQAKILGRLGLAVVDKENEDARARRITEYLTKRRYVLILDNVWNEVDLKVVGVPIGTRQAKSKVIVATRIESVCNRMNAEETKIHVKCLDEEGAWSLFAEKAGKELIESDWAIRRHAEILVKKCGGLPCALIAIGQEMAGKDAPELWKHAITKLENTPLEIHPMKDVHNRLKRSYDNLADDRLKTCLLYCALYPEGGDIHSQWIVDYCIGEGILDDQFYDGDDVYNEGYNLLNILKSASMLELGSRPAQIKMHPMMRISVSWIESGTAEKKCLIRAGKGLVEAPKVDEWRGVERISLMNNRIRKLSEKPHSPCLLTLFLHRNPLEEICNGFFRSMKNIRVLDLSHTKIQEVPPEIGELDQLQYLDFCDTNITSLPQELGKLVRLRYLLLSHTPNLISIPKGLIGELSELRVLYMYKGFRGWKVDSTGMGVNMEELRFLKRLKTLSISVNTFAALKKLAGSNQLAQCTRSLEILVCPGLLSTATLGSIFKGLEELRLYKCYDFETFSIDGPDECLISRLLIETPRARICWESGCLQNLKSLVLTHSTETRQLIHCVNESIEEEDILEEIDVLPSLYKLELTYLPELETLSCGSRPLAFPSLEILLVYGCLKLKKLPLNAKKLRHIHGQQSWWNKLEWPENPDDFKSRIESIFEAKYEG